MALVRFVLEGQEKCTNSCTEDFRVLAEIGHDDPRISGFCEDLFTKLTSATALYGVERVVNPVHKSAHQC